MASIPELILSIDPRVRIVIVVMILILQVGVLFFPKDLFMMYLGLIYGTFTGMWINFVSFAGMTWLGYEIGRTGKLGLNEKKENPTIAKFRRWVDKYGIKAVMINRLIPIIPTNFVSYGSGMAELDRREYMLASIASTAPWAFIWAFIGANYLQLALNYLPSGFQPLSIFIGFLGFMVLGIIVAIFKRFV